MAIKKWNKCLAVLLLAAMVLGLLSGCADAVTEMRAEAPESWSLPKGKKIEAKDDYVVVAESDTYKLWYYEPRFSIKLENKITGTVMESTVSDDAVRGDPNRSWTGYIQSGIVIFAIKGTTNTYQVDMNTCKNTITTYAIENGICANIFFTDYQFGLAVEVTLEDDELVVRVPDGSITEKKKDTYISTVSLFPMLGHSYLGEKDGYMLIPDGNGALIYLSDKDGRYSSGFSRLIYGVDYGFEQTDNSSYLWERFETVTDPNAVMAPIFGMAHTSCNQAYLAIVESGDERCSIEAQPNGVMIDYNRCFARFLLRDIFVQPLNNSNSGTVKTVETDRLHADLQVRYCLLSGEEANYSGMANAYRDYLLETGMVVPVDCGYNTRVDILGSDREEFLLGTTAVTMTTTEQAAEIYAQLREMGVSSVLSVYKGWQKGGIYSWPVSDYKADSAIGGTEALTELIRQQAERGYDVYLYNNATLVNDATTAFTFDVMKMVNKRTFKIETRDQVYDLFYYLLPSRTGGNLERLTADLSKKGIDGMALTGITNTLFSYSSKGSYYSRSDTQASYIDTVKAADEKLDLLLENPNAYLWQYADAYLDMPLGSSDYLYVDQDVPFLSMVLKGVLPMYSKYVNFEANKVENFLQMVESGIYPSFYLTWGETSQLLYTNSSNLYSLEFETYKDTVAEYDAELRQLAQKTADANIIRHETLSSGVVKVTYSNGVQIFVNYTEHDFTADGITVEALSYKVGEQA